MPPLKKRKLGAAVDDEPAKSAPQEEMEPTDATAKAQERQERFKALQARAVSTFLRSPFSG